MPDFVNNMLGFVPEAEWLNVGFNVQRPNDPIDTLFGDERTSNLMARWQTIADEYNTPMMAQFHAFDTESQKTFRIPVDTHNVEKGLIKVKINQSERMRELLNSGVRQNELYNYVLDDGIRLADQVVTRSKVAKNELLATGQVTIHENNLDLTVDYGVDAAQKNFTIDLTGDVLAQIQAVIDAAAAKGVTLTGMMTSRKTLSKIRQNSQVSKDINGALGGMVRMANFEDFMSSEFGINQVLTNDLSYGASSTIGTDGRPQITSKRYFPEDTISFFAANVGGKIGEGIWGDPPEVSVGAHLDVSQSAASPYVYVTQWAEKDPAVLWTKASGLFMPVLYNPSSLWIAETTETTETTGEA